MGAVIEKQKASFQRPSVWYVVRDH